MWFISNDIDSDPELDARMEFYQRFRRNKLRREHKCEDVLNAMKKPGYVFFDGNPDSRCMIVGHTDFVCAVMWAVKRQHNGVFTFYICTCLESYEVFKRMCLAYRLKSGYEVYVTVQELDILCDSKLYLCEYLQTEVTGLGFKITKSELNLLNTGRKSFYGNLKECFVPLDNYKDMGAVK